MGLKNCPNCNLVLFDTDTFCIYCGWGKEELAKPQEEPEIPKAAVEENIKPAIEAQTHVKAQPKKTPEQKSKPADNQPIGANKVTITEYKKGMRCINDVTFNMFDIIKNYGVHYPIQVIKEICRVSGASLSTAKTLFDEAREDYIAKYPEEKTDAATPTKKQTYTTPKPKKDSKTQSYILMAYDLVLQHGPKRKATIINELIRRVHIDLATAVDAVDTAIEKFDNRFK